MPERLIGFINRAGGAQTGSVERPFKIQPGEGANFTEHSEGIKYKNLLGTYLTGPILVRNPPLLIGTGDGNMSLKQSWSTDKNEKANDIVSRDNQKNDSVMSYLEKAYEIALNTM